MICYFDYFFSWQQNNGHGTDMGCQSLLKQMIKERVMRLRNTSWSSRCDAEINTSSKIIIMGSQGFFHGIFMLNFPTRPSKEFQALLEKRNKSSSAQTHFCLCSTKQSLHQKIQIEISKITFSSKNYNLEKWKRARFQVCSVSSWRQLFVFFKVFPYLQKCCEKGYDFGF